MFIRLTTGSRRSDPGFDPQHWKSSGIVWQKLMKKRDKVETKESRFGKDKNI